MKGFDWQALWDTQWALHSPYYRDGLTQLNLLDFGGINTILKLKPGAGFGDLSHPTTRLTLKMMLPLIPNQTVLDVGSGSGILALAAAASRAHAVYACDIDNEALLHGQKNAALNGLKVTWGYPEEIPQLKTGAVALMNMIRSEQAVAWESLRQNHSYIETWITSGVLSEEKETYLKETEKRGWQLQSCLEEANWLVFRFTTAL